MQHNQMINISTRAADERRAGALDGVAKYDGTGKAPTPTDTGGGGEPATVPALALGASAEEWAIDAWMRLPLIAWASSFVGTVRRAVARGARAARTRWMVERARARAVRATRDAFGRARRRRARRGAVTDGSFERAVDAGHE